MSVLCDFILTPIVARTIELHFSSFNLILNFRESHYFRILFPKLFQSDPFSTCHESQTGDVQCQGHIARDESNSTQNSPKFAEEIRYSYAKYVNAQAGHDQT